MVVWGRIRFGIGLRIKFCLKLEALGTNSRHCEPRRFDAVVHAAKDEHMCIAFVVAKQRNASIIDTEHYDFREQTGNGKLYFECAGASGSKVGSSKKAQKRKKNVRRT